MPWTHDTKPFVLIKGPLIVNLESCFFHWQRYPRRRVAPQTPPLHEPARPRELEQPYRIGHGHAFRLPLTRRGLVLGYWVPPELEVLEEEESGRLLAAVEGAMIPGVTAAQISTWSRGRKSWLMRLREWAHARWRTVATSEMAQEIGFSVADTQVAEYDDVVPYDGTIYDLEDARVDLPPSSAS